MDIQQALKVVKALADGVDPDTGEATLLSQNVIHALNRLVEHVEHFEGRKLERQWKLPTNAGRPWTCEEDAQVCDELKKGVKFSEIAKTHGRTNGAIVSRLVRLGQIAPYSAPQKIA